MIKAYKKKKYNKMDQDKRDHWLKMVGLFHTQWHLNKDLRVKAIKEIKHMTGRKAFEAKGT